MSSRASTHSRAAVMAYISAAKDVVLDEFVWSGRLLPEIVADMAGEILLLREIIRGMADRVAAQSELLSRKAEK